MKGRPYYISVIYIFRKQFSEMIKCIKKDHMPNITSQCQLAVPSHVRWESTSTSHIYDTTTRIYSPETLREMHHGVHSIGERGCTKAAAPPVNACATRVYTS